MDVENKDQLENHREDVGDFSDFLKLTDQEFLDIDKQHHKLKLDNDYLDSLLHLSNSATPSPWHPRAGDDDMCMNSRWCSSDPGKGFVHDGFIRDENPDKVIAITLLQSPRLATSPDLHDFNLQLICEYREAVPLLVQEIKRLRKELESGDKR